MLIILMTSYSDPYFQLSSDSFRFPACNFIKKEMPAKMNFVKFLRTTFDRSPPNDFFLSLSVNFEKFLRTPLLKSTSEKLLFSCTSCAISRSSPDSCNFINKETLAQVFSCEFYEISKNTLLHRTPLDDCF